MVIEKVLAYILQNNKVLVFEHEDHPEAGIQVPAGTIQKNESPEAAVEREIQEETSLKVSTFQKFFLGKFDYTHPYRKELHSRNVFALRTEEKLPEFWLHRVSSEDEDRNLKFQIYWLPIEEAKTKLAV